MSVDRTKLKGLYARLKGIERAVGSALGATVLDPALGQDLNSLVYELGQVLSEDMSNYQVRPEGSIHSGGQFLNKRHVEGKLFQLLSYLEQAYHVGTDIVEIGTLYNSIQDEELKSRCSDLLSAHGHFDRVINQATQVLEVRIRTKSENTENLAGTQLVNAVLKTKISDTVLKVSNNDGEQEGIAHICRGIMGAFRNPAHHEISDNFTREEALKLCAFVDNLLRIIDNATVQGNVSN